MKYIKIKILKDKTSNPLFYRTILIRDDIDLLKLGALIGYSTGINLNKCFSIKSNEIKYVSKNHEEKNKLKNYKYLIDYNVSDLDESFDYEYENSYLNNFYCKKYKRKVNYDSSKEFIILEGLGNFSSLEKVTNIIDYKNNKLDEYSKEELEAYYEYELSKFSISNESIMMFEHIDIDKINFNLNIEFENIYKKLLERENINLSITNKC